MITKSELGGNRVKAVVTSTPVAFTLQALVPIPTFPFPASWFVVDPGVELRIQALNPQDMFAGQVRLLNHPNSDDERQGMFSRLLVAHICNGSAHSP